MKKLVPIIIFVIVLIPAFAAAQEGGKLSFQVTPGVNIPLATTTEMFTIGGGGELTVAYSMPFPG